MPLHPFFSEPSCCLHIGAVRLLPETGRANCMSLLIRNLFPLNRARGCSVCQELLFFPVACNSRPCAIPCPATQRLQDACAPIPSDQLPAAMIAGHVPPHSRDGFCPQAMEVLCSGSRSIVPKGLARDVVGDTVDMRHFGNDAFADTAQNRIWDLCPLEIVKLLCYTVGGSFGSSDKCQTRDIL